MPFKLNAIWKTGSLAPRSGPVHVSMNDYLIHRFRDVPRVARAGFRLRRRWHRTEGALGLWFASFRAGRRRSVFVVMVISALTVTSWDTSRGTA